MKRPWQHLYNTARWKRIRKLQLQQYPLCSMCHQQGIFSMAEVVDHITPHKGNEQLFYDGPFQSLCKLHHDSTKQSDERTGNIKGSDINGEPLDPKHHWN